jgi:hypothetical protein
MNLIPNWFAYLVLLTWPLVALWLYSSRSVPVATIWTILGAHLLLPVRMMIKFEMIPQFDKTTIPSLCALAGCLFSARRRRSFSTRFGLAEVLVFVALIGPFITSLLNTDAVFVGGRVLPGVGPYDAFSATESVFLSLLPFLLGRRYLADNTEDILRALVVAGLCYSLPMLFEIRMSPQLHTWIYGYSPRSFAQQMREGGFRPTVFLGHGLIVAMFTATTVLASATLWRARIRVAKIPPAGITSYLGVMLVLCKSLASLIYGLVLAPVILFCKPRLMFRAGLVIATLVIFYPVLRTSGYFPTSSITDIAASTSPERSESLKFRYDQEDRLLRRASERIVFGWGRYGRYRLFDEDSGEDVTVTDGHWIITLGQFGIIGFVTEFGLLLFPIFRAFFAYKFASTEKEKILLGGLTLILAISVLDLLPNDTLTPWVWLMAGALLGRAEVLQIAGRRERPSARSFSPSPRLGSAV